MKIGSSNLSPPPSCVFILILVSWGLSLEVFSLFLFAHCIVIYDVVLTSPCHSLISLLLSFPEKSGADLYTQLVFFR